MKNDKPFKDNENKKQNNRGATACKKKDVHCELPKNYDPQYVETAWYAWWETQGFFRPEYYDEHPPSNASTPRKNFTMVIRPPSITDYRHLDLALMCTFEDIICRWRRMCGDTVLWVPGCDNADTAIQVVVESELIKQQKLTRYDLGREKFLKEVSKWKNDKGDHIYQQIKALGSSCDWSRTFSTMDNNRSYAVEEAFIRLHEKKLIYRSTRFVNWSCTLKSAISDIEMEKKELKGRTLIDVPGYEQPVEFGVLIYFAYPVEDSKEEIIVGTTRLETMLGDTAVIVNPNDERYKHLQGKFIQHPFLPRRLPILVDKMVDSSFGFGAVKVTPAHDPKDFEYTQRQSIPFITCINDDGLMSSECGSYAGKPRFDVRQQLLNDLKERGLYRDSKENEMILLICSQNKDIIEPLFKPQWYVNCKNMAKRAIELVQNKEIKISPIIYEPIWYKWLEDVDDWCISKQLWWGHRVPTYFVSSNDIPVGNENDDYYWISAHSYEEALDKAAQRFNISKDKIRLTQDEDVLDTWFSSSLLPFSSFGWPMETDDFKKFFPTTLFETNHDTLFSLVTRMVMMSFELTGRLPFKEVYVYDKSSKTLQEEFNSSKEHYQNDISQEGIDVLRFSICESIDQGQHINLNERSVKESRVFCNQLWKVIRDAMSRGLDINDPNCFKPPTEKFKLTGAETPCDLWILSRLSYLIQECENGFKNHQLHSITTALYNFWIPEFHDIYIDCIRKDFYPAQQNMERQNIVKLILFICLNNGLRLTAPIMPYLCEEFYQRLTKRNNEQNSCLVVTPYPQSNEFNQYRNQMIEKKMTIIKEAINGYVSYCTTSNIPRDEDITLYIKSSSFISAVFIELLEVIRSFANINNIQPLNEEPTSDQTEYQNIFSTVNYKLYYKQC